MRLLIIGGVAAGMSAAARARRCDKNLEIVVLEKGPAVSWGACGLPYWLEGRLPKLEHLIVYTPEYWKRERNITVRTGAEVASISHSRRQVALAGGESVHYDRLVVATGARPERTTIPGSGLPHVFTLASMEDARGIRAFLDEKNPRRAAVIGAGSLGLEVAEMARAHGCLVTIFEARADVLRREDPALTEAVRKHLERYRIQLRLGERVRAIEAGTVNGEPFEVVFLAAGFRPNAELAAEAGIELGRTGAIRTDERLETNLTGVFAAGDCAECAHLITGRPAWAPLGTSANKMGRVAGANAAGKRERFPGVVGTRIVRACGQAFAVTGLSEGQARREGIDVAAVRIEALDRPRYFFGTPVSVSLVADRRTGRLIGGSVVGEEGVPGRINVIATALTAGMQVADFEELDLAYAPPYATVWDPLLIAAQQLSKLV